MEINKRNPLTDQIQGILKIIMRTILLLFCITTFGLTPKESLSQKIRIDADKTVSVDELFRIIKSQTREYMFIYKADLFEGLPEVDLKKGVHRMDRLINQTLRNAELSVVVTQNNTILIKEGRGIQQQISGKVTDPEGGPIPGVTVLVKGTTVGTTTDFDGMYSIRVPNPENVLVFTSIGFAKQQITVGNRTTINVIMEESVSELDEVVVNAGYYSVKEREATGNIEKVTAKEIELQPLVSPMQTLQGRMAGVEVVPQGNLPGAAPTIRIRGQNSLRADGNYPLYIIDGVPINATPIESNSNLAFIGIDPLSTINLNNVESIEVLKDADATSIYGSRGANGVVLITTKQGHSGKSELEARVYSGMSSVPNRMDLLHTEDYLRIREQAFINDGVEPTQYNAYDLIGFDQNKYTDWQDVFFGATAQVSDVNLSLSGGNANTNFRVSGSYHSQGTVYPGDSKYNKVTAGLNLNHVSDNHKFKLNMALNYGLDINNLEGRLSVFSTMANLAPNAPDIFNEDGSLHWEGWADVIVDNPFQGAANSSETRADNLISSLVLSYELFTGLTIKSNFGYTRYHSDELMKYPKRSYNPLYWQAINHESAHLASNRNSWIIEPQLTYGASIGKAKVDVVVGSTFQENKNHIQGVTGSGYVTESLIGDLAAAETISRGRNQTTVYRYNAVFARVGLNWDQRYLLNLTARRDGSSRFGAENRFANFGAVGAAWLFSNENFIKNSIPFVSYGKIRGSYGTTGNDQIGDYRYLDAYQATPGPNGLYPTQLANPYYSWEENKKLEIAMELGLFQNRIDVGANWYRNRSSNQLVGYPLPGTTGFSSVQYNLPALVENSGIELNLSTRNIATKNFQWRTSLNLSFPKNKLVNFPGIEESSYANTYRVGEPLNINLLYEYQGIAPETGLYSFTDINGDGTFDYEDRVGVQDNGRKLFGGLNNDLSYKNLSLQFLWQFAQQDGRLTLFDAGMVGMQRASVARALEEGNGFLTISRSSDASRAYRYAGDSELAYTDASFLRLKTLTLGYDIPDRALFGLGLNACRVFISGQNLLTITGYDGLDPEIPLGNGMNFGGLRTILLGAQFNF